MVGFRKNGYQALVGGDMGFLSVVLLRTVQDMM